MSANSGSVAVSSLALCVYGSGRSWLFFPILFHTSNDYPSGHGIGGKPAGDSRQQTVLSKTHVCAPFYPNVSMIQSPWQADTFLSRILDSSLPGNDTTRAAPYLTLSHVHEHTQTHTTDSSGYDSKPPWATSRSSTYVRPAGSTSE